MYPSNHAPPFGSPHSRDPPGRPGSFTAASTGHLPSGFSPSPTDGHFRHTKPSFARPQYSSFPLDYYSMIGLGSTYQRLPHWSTAPVQSHLPDPSDRASEEFLRCIAANKPLPNYLKGNMEYNLADAFKSADVVKEAVRSDPDLQKLLTRSKSCSRSSGKNRAKSRARSRSRGKSRARSRSRGKSRARSQSRGKSRARSRSRGKSRARSQSRGKSCARSQSRGKSCARSRSRGRSKSRARGKSALRERHGSSSRSQTRVSSPTQSWSRAQRSSSSSSSRDQEKGVQKSSSRVDKDENPPGRCLLKGLKMVLSSRELEGGFSNLKHAFIGIKASNESQTAKLFPGQLQNLQENSTTGEDPIILPHNRVGSDFSWLQGSSQKERKEKDIEAEESFLYGNEESKSSEILSSGKHGRAQEAQLSHHTLSNSEQLRKVQQHLQNTSRMASALLDSTECEKIRSILKCLGSADTARGQALEASFIKETQEACTRPDGNGSSHHPAGTHKTDDNEPRSRLKRATASQMEVLMKELQKLMKHNGLDFLTPVIGFYCQKCEEFFGDWSSAENHATIHCCPEVRPDKCAGGREMHSHHSNKDICAPRCPSDKKDHKDSNYHSNPGVQLTDREWREEQDGRNRHQTASKESLFLEEEMRKERMLITVSQEPSHVNHHKDLQTVKSEKTMKTKSQKKKKKKKDAKKTSKKDKS